MDEQTPQGETIRSIAAPTSVRVQRMHGGRPVLKAQPDRPWESNVVLNPAAVLIDDAEQLRRLSEAWDLPRPSRGRLLDAGGACVMLYRAQGERVPEVNHAVSRIGLAVLTPEMDLVWRRSEPVLSADRPFQNLGVEDPRCTLVDDTYHLYYTGYSSGVAADGAERRRVRICLATTRDFVVWNQYGPVDGDINDVDNKNAALLPVPVDGKWLLLHRPMEGPGAMAIHLAESDRPEGPWTTRGELMRSYRYREFDKSWIGGGGPPLPLGSDRFLMIYHQGHYTSEGTREYDLAAALLDFRSDHPVRSRLEPVLRPTEEGERTGDPDLGVDNVVFTCANYRWGDRLVIPYAGADSRIFGASIAFDQLVEALEQQS